MSCSICIDDAHNPFISKCNHSFCNKCILEWITQNDDCPLCRNPIAEPSSNYVSDNDHEEDEEPIYNIILDGYYTIHDEEIIFKHIYDYIMSYDYDPKYKWKESPNGLSSISIRNKKYYIDLKFEMSVISTNNYILYVKIDTRKFIKYTKQYKFNKKINNYK